MPEHLAALVVNLAARDPEKPVFTFLHGEGSEQTVSAGELHRDARVVAGILRAEGVQSGEILPLVFDHGYDLVAAFWGAIYLGAVPTILPYISPGAGTKSYLEQVARLVRFTGAPIVVTTRDLALYLTTGLGAGACRVAALAPNPFSGAPDDGEAWRLRPPSAPPYIQFSSGTTGAPKGVVMSQTAILEYERLLAERTRATGSDVMVGWLPLYHDMGLTNQLLRPLYVGHSSVLMSPAAWLNEPHRLFQAVHRFRGTVTWMPNFAYSYCTRRVRDERIAGIDLSSWRLVGNASEPVYLQEMDAFARRFAAYGLRREALTISYGLAEHVAAVTHTVVGRFPAVDWVRDAELAEGRAVAAEAQALGSRAIVSCGPPLGATELRIVDGAGRALPERRVGEILVRGPCVFDGYYRDPDESGVSLERGWLRTGDLGYLAGGELYVCGRKKDLIIVGGRNLHPNHLEEIAAGVAGPSCRFAAAFGVRLGGTGTETPVVVCEMRQLPEAEAQLALRREIRERLRQTQQVFVNDVLLVESGWIPKTTSGKINRAASRDRYLAERPPDSPPAAKANPPDERVATPTATERRVLAIWEALFGRQGLGLDDDFFDLGGDSLLAAEMAIEIEIQFQRILPASILLDATTVAALARHLDQPESPPPVTTLLALRPARERSTRPAFFCVHGLGGGILGYLPLARAVGPEQPFYALQTSGANGDGIVDASIEDMARHYVQEIRALQPAGPYHLGGYCFGGVVAYEMARQLAGVGEDVALVAILEGYAPSRTSGQTSRWRDWVRSLPFWLRDYLRLGRVQMKARNRRLLRLAGKRLLGLLGGRVAVDARDFMDDAASQPARIQRLITAHLAAAARYLPSSSYDGRLVLFRTGDRLRRAPEDDRGWSRLSIRPVEVEMIPGSHATILDEPHVRVLAEKLAVHLRRDMEGTAPSRNA